MSTRVSISVLAEWDAAEKSEYGQPRLESSLAREFE